jgi:hypothetical protein
MNTFFYIDIKPLERTSTCPWVFGMQDYFSRGGTWGPYADLASAVKALDLMDFIIKLKGYKYTITEYCIDEEDNETLVDEKIYGEVKNA